MRLYIANKNYSSWSLRGWLCAKLSGAPFEEVLEPFRSTGSNPKFLEFSPSGLVPCLHDGDNIVWDSLAIAEYLAERHPHMWPRDAAARAFARSITCEMHSGFRDLRMDMTMCVKERLYVRPWSPALAANVARVEALWSQARERFGRDGPYLFGEFSIADCFYAPVAFRFQTYDVAPGGREELKRWLKQTVAAIPDLEYEINDIVSGGDDVVIFAHVTGTIEGDLPEYGIEGSGQAADFQTAHRLRVRDGRIVGHVAASPVTIDDGTPGWYGLGPVSVAPQWQGRGLGSRLVRAALAELRELGARGCLLVGEPGYYGRFGFRAEPQLVYPGVPPQYFQALCLEGALPAGVVTFDPAFQAQA